MHSQYCVNECSLPCPGSNHYWQVHCFLDAGDLSVLERKPKVFTSSVFSVNIMWSKKCSVSDDWNFALLEFTFSTDDLLLTSYCFVRLRQVPWPMLYAS